MVVDAGAEGAADAQALPATVLGKPTLRFDLQSLPTDPHTTASATSVSPDARAILFTTSGTTSAAEPAEKPFGDSHRRPFFHPLRPVYRWHGRTLRQRQGRKASARQAPSQPNSLSCFGWLLIEFVW